MKKSFFILIASFGLWAGSCSKSNSSKSEAAISFTTDASPLSVSVSSSFELKVTLTSAMPGQGIKITTSITDQTTNTSLNQPAPITSTAVTNTVALIGLPQQHLCNVIITVTSVATPTNTASQRFTVVYK